MFYTPPFDNRPFKAHQSLDLLSSESESSFQAKVEDQPSSKGSSQKHRTLNLYAWPSNAYTRDKKLEEFFNSETSLSNYDDDDDGVRSSPLRLKLTSKVNLIIDASQIAGVLPDCQACPMHARCEEGKIVGCETDYVLRHKGIEKTINNWMPIIMRPKGVSTVESEAVENSVKTSQMACIDAIARNIESIKALNNHFCPRLERLVLNLCGHLDEALRTHGADLVRREAWLEAFKIWNMPRLEKIRKDSLDDYGDDQEGVDEDEEAMVDLISAAGLKNFGSLSISNARISNGVTGESLTNQAVIRLLKGLVLVVEG
ncbi:hypothetical protein BY996DRAFT_6417693 [Phakopsora pachyrhizi]|nr:hypothetical protein BY996DRAFT_6417693 [Phakopsora pachyrhizi]